ncbi:G-protein coupled receptor 183-like [Ctenodactylus gundi]
MNAGRCRSGTDMTPPSRLSPADTAFHLYLPVVSWRTPRAGFGMDPWGAPGNSSSCGPYLPSRAASVALALFYTALLVFSALGNALALCVACRRGKKTNSTGVYLVHMAASDLLFTLALPGKIAYYVLDFSWPFGDGLCRLTAFVMYLNTYGGIYLMACVSVDRYLAVVRARQGARARSAGRARRVCAAVWALALAQTGPLLGVPMATTAAGRLTCMEYASVEPVLGLHAAVLAACAVCFGGPLAVMLFCYARIALRLRRAAGPGPGRGDRGPPRRAWLLSLLLLAAAVLCFSPYHLTVMQFMARRLLGPPSCAARRDFTRALQVTVTLMNANCGVDPVLYFFASTRYRRCLQGFLRLRAGPASPGSSCSLPGRSSTEAPSASHTSAAERAA